MPNSKRAYQKGTSQTLRDCLQLSSTRSPIIPISRYLEYLLRSGNYERYMSKLVAAYNPAAAAAVMCRNTLSVGWDGTLYDCDFNQMLELPVASSAPQHIDDFSLARLAGRQITTGRHCYGCTAGAGSSCQGQLVSPAE
jgi:radical SAM/Cys-rich protein